MDIAKKINVDQNTILRRLYKWGITVRSLSEQKLGFNIKDYSDDICKSYINGETSLSLEKRYNVHNSVIRKILIENNIKKRKRTNSPVKEKIENNKNEIIKLYIQDNLSINNISNKYNVSKSSILRKLKEWNVPIRNNSECKIGCCKGKDNYNSKQTILYDLKENKKYIFDCKEECANWMVKNNISKKLNTAKDAIYTSIKLKRPYKKRYNFEIIN